MSLNSAQREAVFTLTGPLLVLAGAGTGKTRVVTYRIAELIRRRTRPSRILAVTFTNKAAREMLDRAAGLLGGKPTRPARGKESTLPEISTFHSLCVRVLRRHITRLGYPAEFAIYDRGQQESVARQALREIKVPSESLRPGDLIYHVGRWKSLGVKPADAPAHAQTEKEHLAAAGYRRYQTALKTAGALDFDDLLLCTEELFSQFAEVRRDEAARFDHVLVDEYQDTNGSQYRIIKCLAAPHRNLCVVGDDDQSIYGWRGAEVTHILSFQKDWPEARVIRLEENYRSTAEILTVANRLIAFNRLRHEKVLRAARPNGERPRILQMPDETKEAEHVVADIEAQLRQPGAQPRDFAILCRTNEQPRPFEMALRKAKLPYVLMGGMSFYDRREVRDIVAYLKLLVNPRDEVSLLRIINTPARGIAQPTVAKLMEAAVGEGKPLWEILPTAGAREGVTPVAAENVAKFVALINYFRKRLENPSPFGRGQGEGQHNSPKPETNSTLPHPNPLPGSTPLTAGKGEGVQDTPVAVVADLITEIKYQQELQRQYKEPADQQSRWAAVEEVVNALGSFCKGKKRPKLADFLDEITLLGREDEQDKESQLARNAIALMTLHSAKGLEFPQVYLVGMEEGLLPHHRSLAADGQAIDEERRLCYVGVTRAMDRLTLSLALSRMKWGKSRESVPSRFLYELTGQAEKAGDQKKRTQGAAAQAPAPTRHTAKRSARPVAKTARARSVTETGIAAARRRQSRPK